MNGIIRFKDNIRASLSRLCLFNCRLFPSVKRPLELRHRPAIALLFQFATYSAVVLLLALTTAVPVRADEETAKPSVVILPGTGPVGTEIIVQITGFPPKTGVVIAAREKSIIVQKSITDDDGIAAVTFTLQPQPSGWCQIWAYDNVHEAWAMFTVVPSMKLDKTSGYVDDEVVIDGDGFAAAKKVTVHLDSKAIAEGTTNDKGELTDISFKVPKSCKGKHEIAVEDGKNDPCQAEFLVRQKMSVSPDPIEADSDVQIIGTGFSAAADVMIYFDDQDIDIAPADEDGSFDVTFRAPKASGGIHKIKADDGENKYYADITVSAAMSCKPAEGNIGGKITVDGTGFRAGIPITVSFDNQQIDAITSSAEGAFLFGFNVPPCVHGEHKIVASDGSTTKQAKFIVESNPPLTPRLISPTSASRLTKVERFEWEGVTDPSGVKYILEIGSDEQLSTIILSQKNLSSTGFSLSEEQQKLLRPGKTPYYWRVKAIDGASNASQWSDVNSLEVGASVSTIVKNMPPWVTYTLVGLLFALIATFFYTLGSRIRNLKQAEYEDDSIYDEDQTSYSNPYDTAGNQGDPRRIKYK